MDRRRCRLRRSRAVDVAAAIWAEDKQSFPLQFFLFIILHFLFFFFFCGGFKKLLRKIPTEINNNYCWIIGWIMNGCEKRARRSVRKRAGENACLLFGARGHFVLPASTSTARRHIAIVHLALATAANAQLRWEEKLSHSPPPPPLSVFLHFSQPQPLASHSCSLSPWKGRENGSVEIFNAAKYATKISFPTSEQISTYLLLSLL